MTFEEWRKMTLLPGDNVKAAWKAWNSSRKYALAEAERVALDSGTGLLPGPALERIARAIAKLAEVDR